MDMNKNKYTLTMLFLTVFFLICFFALCFRHRDKTNALKDYSATTHISCNFTSSKFNADKYILSGISTPEGGFTWSDSKEIVFKKLNASNLKEKELEISVLGIYRSEQTVVLFCNDERIGETKINGQSKVEFNFPQNMQNEVELKILLPDAVCPKDVSDSLDVRTLALMLEYIDIK